MDVEQEVVGSKPFGRRRHGRCSRTADVFEALWSQQFDRGEKCGGLLGRDRKTISPQQCCESEEDLGGLRQAGLAHVIASGSSASSRGATKDRSSSSFNATPIERLNASGQRAPVLFNSVAASAQSTASAIPGALLRGSRRSFATACTTARAVASATLEARIIT